jgi:hypothetical protein
MIYDKNDVPPPDWELNDKISDPKATKPAVRIIPENDLYASLHFDCVSIHYVSLHLLKPSC